MKPNDIIMIYSSPFKCEQPEGRAKLIRLIETCGCFELWDVEFLDCPGKEWPRLIKKT